MPRASSNACKRPTSGSSASGSTDGAPAPPGLCPLKPCNGALLLVPAPDDVDDDPPWTSPTTLSEAAAAAAAAADSAELVRIDLFNLMVGLVVMPPPLDDEPALRMAPRPDVAACDVDGCCWASDSALSSADAEKNAPARVELVRCTFDPLLFDWCAHEMADELALVDADRTDAVPDDDEDDVNGIDDVAELPFTLPRGLRRRFGGGDTM